ncbi:MAG: pyridoxamine 5'-phosphate oxidase family protein [Candidatus Heimdallarchaeota archaeon]|nr:MAG: pyridoxamine 5'-phosphate oxidase family protein [Candidatus Heimdallarchaeota archaeon]
MYKSNFDFSFIEKKIRTKTFGILTTLNKDGTPHSTGVLYGVSPPSSAFSLIFFTSKKYKKVRNIKRNPNVSFVIPFSHSFLRFTPSKTVTFNGKAELISLNDCEIRTIFSRKRILRLIITQSQTEDQESFTFVRIIPNPKVLCYGLGINVLKLRKGHRHGGYSVIIPKERLPPLIQSANV